MLSGFLTLLWAQERDNRALGFWSLGFSAGALGMVLVSVRELAPPIVAFGLGNGLGISCLGLIWLGCLAFEGETRKGAGLLAAAGGVVWLSLFAIPTFAADLGARIFAASILYAGYSFLILPVLFFGQRREPLPARMVAIVAFGTHGAAHLIRIPMQLIEPVQLVAGHAPLWYGAMTFAFFLQGLASALAIFAMVRERATRRYKIASETDALTLLRNRRAFIDAIARARGGAGGSAPGALLALVDADHFKQVNDTYGHPAGDAVLVELGRLLTREVPEAAIVGRLGGEEFGVYLPASVVLRQPDLLDDLRIRVGHMLVEHEDQLPAITISIGAASLPSGPLDFPLALARADKALYASKKAGRNRVTWGGLDFVGEGQHQLDVTEAPSELSSAASRSAA
ncbi:GGDEF domain-containing protein [Allorhizobium sp. NPDC080224]|uniref:GGDEF domain-containing protein n=1 Tax=Allorhizobium sp. NPDC080224 TaxID=3390547 RepID=UPI003CFC5D80